MVLAGGGQVRFNQRVLKADALGVFTAQRNPSGQDTECIYHSESYDSK